jgi:hypothetical protein
MNRGRGSGGKAEMSAVASLVASPRGESEWCRHEPYRLNSYRRPNGQGLGIANFGAGSSLVLGDWADAKRRLSRMPLDRSGTRESWASLNFPPRIAPGLPFGVAFRRVSELKRGCTWFGRLLRPDCKTRRGLDCRRFAFPGCAAKPAPPGLRK